MSAVSGGLLAFGSVFVEMFFILSSIWQHRFYYVFGFSQGSMKALLRPYEGAIKALLRWY